MWQTSTLTYKQLVQKLNERLIVLYFTLLGHEINSISYQIGYKTLTIVIEDSLTRPEQLLASNGQWELAKRVRYTINKALQPELKLLIEKLVNVPVIDLLCNTGFDTGCTSMVAVLATMPEVFNSDVVKSQQTVSEEDIAE